MTKEQIYIEVVITPNATNDNPQPNFYGKLLQEDEKTKLLFKL